eukprot:SAG22_NODE_1274_length_4921_cov_4.998548_1_plen_213_part_10
MATATHPQTDGALPLPLHVVLVHPAGVPLCGRRSPSRNSPAPAQASPPPKQQAADLGGAQSPTPPRPQLSCASSSSEPDETPHVISPASKLVQRGMRRSHTGRKQLAGEELARSGPQVPQSELIAQIAAQGLMKPDYGEAGWQEELSARHDIAQEEKAIQDEMWKEEIDPWLQERRQKARNRAGVRLVDKSWYEQELRKNRRYDASIRRKRVD